MTERKHPHISDEMLAAAWPCPACGALEPDRETGHDPCIKNLPGVQYACCGHGRNEGYVKFTDGRVLRGRFEDTPQGVGRFSAYFDAPYSLGDTFDVLRAMWGRGRAESIKLTWVREMWMLMFPSDDDEPA